MRNAIAALRTRRDGDERGFTLIELMVVVLIIAILIAIAIPTFLGARQRAQDKAAQSSLRNGLTAAKTIYTDSETYVDALPGTANTALQDTEIWVSLTAVAVTVSGARAMAPLITSANGCAELGTLNARTVIVYTPGTGAASSTCSTLLRRSGLPPAAD